MRCHDLEEGIFEEWRERSRGNGDGTEIAPDGLLYRGAFSYEDGYWSRRPGDEEGRWERAERRVLILTKDLNDEACALVKVVGDADFAFSSPLGIVARRNEVGEIWIYLPKGTTRLTIKHPRWGVLRDFRFPNPLESRLTYELIVEGPPEKEEASPFPKVRHRPLAGIWNEWREPVMTTSPVGKQRGIPPVYFLLATCGIQEHEQAPGLMVGLMKRHGIYVHGQTNFRHLPTQGECDEEGRLAGEEAVPYYEPGADHGLWTLTAGGIHRLFGLWHVYEGIGYGERKTVWETREGLRVRNTDY